MFLERFKSSIVIMAITIATVVFGGNVLFGTILLISLIGMFELYKVIKVEKTILGGLGYLACILLDFLIYFKYENYNMLLTISFMIFLLIFFVVTYPKYRAEQIAIVFFGLFYVAAMLSFVYKVRMLEDGAFLVWLIFIGAWGADTCAYLSGITFGKHKILPLLSPKKSLEGYIGGVVGATLLGVIYGTIFKNSIVGVENSQIAYGIICGASSIIAQFGDLAASAIKRNFEIKDYGTLIPGHGGILDRFDSIIFVAPVVYFFAELLKGFL